MLRIAVCDDLPDQLAAITAYVKEYIDANELEAEIRQFDHPDALLTSLEAESFQLYMLDIVMPMISGIELGKEIRRFDREAQIIYTTTEPQFALQAYAASPLNYLIKPIDKAQLFDTLTYAISKIELFEQTFTIKTCDGLRVLKLPEIACCEYRSHAVIFTLFNGEEVISRTIRERFTEYSRPIVQDARFLQCHTSFLVNMRWVERFTKECFTLRGGKVIPISAKQYALVRDQYMNFLMKKEARK